MQNSQTLPGNIPSPPPLPSKHSIDQDCKYLNSSCAKEFKLPKRSSQHDILSALRHITHNFFVENPANLISLYHPISPVIQDGRCCGIVALAMASQLSNYTSPDDILNLAKTMNFTKEGEMFSAFNMATLANTLIDCDAVVLEDLNSHKEDILNHICDGNPVLIPYDADKNHFPCVNHGLSAHWAVISGLCFNVLDKTHLEALSTSETINEFPELNIINVKDNIVAKALLRCAEKIFLYAHQGKSRHLAAWNFNDLIESNNSMYEVTKKYTSEQLVLPSNDYLSELRNKAIVLKIKS